MQSDCHLHSSSLPDQPPNSERPLDSIVTNEGPSKRSYVASSSKQPSESRVFPAVDSFVQRLANDSICSKQIENLSSSDEVISILGEEFNNVATVLESYLSCPDHLQQIRSTLRYTASYPSTFVHILLWLPLLPELTPVCLDSSQYYQRYIHRVLTSPGLFNMLYNPPISSRPIIHLPRQPHATYPVLQQEITDIKRE